MSFEEITPEGYFSSLTDKKDALIRALKRSDGIFTFTTENIEFIRLLTRLHRLVRIPVESFLFPTEGLKARVVKNFFIESPTAEQLTQIESIKGFPGLLWVLVPNYKSARTFHIQKTGFNPLEGYEDFLAKCYEYLGITCPGHFFVFQEKRLNPTCLGSHHVRCQTCGMTNMRRLAEFMTDDLNFRASIKEPEGRLIGQEVHLHAWDPLPIEKWSSLERETYGRRTSEQRSCKKWICLANVPDRVCQNSTFPISYRKPCHDVIFTL